MKEKSDEKFMRRALTLAGRGIGRTSPNPSVGCVIVRDGVIIGEGWHKKAGGPHAEIEALKSAGSKARGSTAYVTLEPCCHTGKTPPCADALIKAGVKRVVAGMEDPNPQVSGKGAEKLRASGIDVTVGLLEDQCRSINRPFIKHVTTSQPYVTYKCAMTLDGNIATVTGDSRWISSLESRRLVHKMRADSDAVMVGVDTILSDNPQLNVRHVRGRDPVRIIVDTTLRTPETVTVLGAGMAERTIIATTEANPKVHQRYINQGARIIVCEEFDGRVSMPDLLAKLGQTGIQSILLEGGSRLAGDMLQNRLIDELIFFIGPKIVGSNGFAPFTLRGITDMEQALRISFSRVFRCGPDIVVRAFPDFSCSQD